MFELTERQVRVIEAALRYATEQAGDSWIKILDWGDGATEYLSNDDEQVVHDETLSLLDDALGALQRQRAR